MYLKFTKYLSLPLLLSFLLVVFLGSYFLLSEKLISYYNNSYNSRVQDTTKRIKETYSLVLHLHNSTLVDSMLSIDANSDVILGLGLLKYDSTLFLIVKDPEIKQLDVDFIKLMRIGDAHNQLTKGQFDILFSNYENIQLQDGYTLKIWFDVKSVENEIREFKSMFINIMVILGLLAILSIFKVITHEVVYDSD